MSDAPAAAVRAAVRLRRRASREKSASFLAEGVQAVREALADTARPGAPAVREIFVGMQARDRHPELVERALALGVPVRLADDRILTQLSDTVTPQGLVAVCDRRDVELAAVLAGRPRLVVLLAAVRDPGNAGTVVRTADAAGADAVVFAGPSVDPYNGKCVRASAGSLFHLALVSGAAPDIAIDALHDAGLQVLAADAAAGIDLDAVERAGRLAAPTAWVFGNEAWGLPDDVVRRADAAVRVPIHGRAESLNLAAAAAVCLYASARAQHAHDPC